MRRQDSPLVAAARNNNEALVSDMLKKGPDYEDVVRAGLNTTNPRIQILSKHYQLLHDKKLGTFFFEYPGRHVTHLMVIAARGYLPLLLEKQDELTPELVAAVDKDGHDAVYYARTSKNDDLINLLLQYMSYEQPTDTMWNILLNTDPLDLYNTCISGRQFSEICSSPEFRREYIRHNAKILKSLLLSHSPNEAARFCGKDLYRVFCSDREFQETYFNTWKSEFADDGFSSDTEYLNYMPTERAITRSGKINVQIFPNDDLEFKLDADYTASMDKLNRLLFPIYTTVILNSNRTIQPDTPFGITLGHFLNNVYEWLYIFSTPGEPNIPSSEIWIIHMKASPLNLRTRTLSMSRLIFNKQFFPHVQYFDDSARQHFQNHLSK